MSTRSQGRRSPKKLAARKKPAPRKTSQSAPAAPATASAPAEMPPAQGDMVVVGVGASAGGLEAFSKVLEALPSEPGVAIVLVQHLAPQHESALAVLLAGRTDLPVVQATDGMQIERNRVYVIPPNVQMSVSQGRLHLSPRPSDRSQYTPIDFFLRSLGEAYQSHAIAIILSGTASDGTIGVRDVKSAGGITIAQRPDTAKYDGMPRAAIATGLVDLILAPAEIGRELARLATHPPSPFVRLAADDPDAPMEAHLEQMFRMLRSATGVDFRRYKRPTIHRRLQRRMLLHKLTSADQYVRLLRENPAEVHALYQDILIHVTRFFRDPEAFAAIATHVLPKIRESLPDGQQIRVWVPGCSTGEEAYSIAITLFEFFAEPPSNRNVPVQIFATDVSEGAIEHARAGLYHQGIVSDVTSERLRRFFTKVDGGYQIIKGIRDVCVFARQDLTRDPPFSKLDLIICRNVLIYLGADLQKKLINVFHYALRPTGFLLLGGAETIGIHTDLFTAVDKKQRIYQKRPAGTSEVLFPLTYAAAQSRPAEAREPRDDTRSVQAEANRLIEERYAPPGVVIDANFQVIQFRGQTGAFLEPAPGDPSHNVLKMAREGLLHGLRAALEEVRRTRAPVCRRGIRVKSNGGWHEVKLDVLPLAGMERMHFIVLFDSPVAAPTPDRPVRRPRRASDTNLARIQQELASSREFLQSIIQELEAANEELQSANEEVLSANEELQSTNEELDTAKEELQSTNEELNTVNEELHGRNEELSRLNSDLINLLSSVHIAIVIVASDLSIRRFTPMAERVLNLIPGDLGRPIGHIKPNIDCSDLEELIARVVDTVTPCEREVHDRQGNAYSLRIRPYKNVENRIDGAVLALFDIEPERDEQVRRAQHLATAVAEAIPQPVAVVDATHRIRLMNDAFGQVLGLRPGETAEGHLFRLGDGRWNAAPAHALLDDVLSGKRDAGEVELGEDSGVPRFRARRFGSGDAADPLVLVLLDAGAAARSTS